MANPFLAEIRIFPFNFAPKGWAFCDGQLLPLSQNTALFSLLGTTYGGDGKSTFALPNMQDNAPMHPGQGPGLSLHDLGESAGTETVTLLESEMPLHTHVIQATNDVAAVPDPGGHVWAQAVSDQGGFPYYHTIGNAPMTPLTPAGGSQPHNNMHPYLTLNFCIALQGVYPPRT